MPIFGAMDTNKPTIPGFMHNSLGYQRNFRGQQEGSSKYQLIPNSKGHKVAKSSREGLSAMGRQGRFVILTK